MLEPPPSSPLPTPSALSPLPPLSLYVHFPWCVRKCPYCDFNSYTLHGEIPEAAYLDVLEADMRAQAAAVAGRPLISVFLGGGTPSLFSPAGIGRALRAARQIFAFQEDVEITLEANPGTIERGRFAGYAAAGVNRVSLGAQSFGERQLAALGRIHSPADTLRAAEELHAAGIGNFNLDLMYGLPQQDVAGARADLRRALALRPAHLSHYQLTLEPGTPFKADPPPLPCEDLTAQMLEICEAELARAGFKHYEISAYARAGRECRHNLNYWTFGDYLGVGAGAHGKLSEAGGRILRTRQAREPRRYLAGAAAASEPVPPRELPFEFMMNALRLTGGIEPGLFEARTGLSCSRVVPIIERLVERGLMVASAQRWQPSPLGLRFLNELLLAFLPEPPAPACAALSIAAGVESAPGAPLYTGLGGYIGK